MTRILDLFWTHAHERMLALGPEQVSELTDHWRSTLYRHLKQLRKMQWIRIDQVGRRLIIRSVFAQNARITERVAIGAEGSLGVWMPGEALF